MVNGEQSSETELALAVLWNSVRCWLNQRSIASDCGGLSGLDVFVLHLIVYRNRPMRVVNLAFALSIDDLHQVTYSLKKLVRLEMLVGGKQGKKCSFPRPKTRATGLPKFQRNRKKYLLPSMQLPGDGDQDLRSMINMLQTLSGVYEQAARSAVFAQQP